MTSPSREYDHAAGIFYCKKAVKMLKIYNKKGKKYLSVKRK